MILIEKLAVSIHQKKIIELEGEILNLPDW